MAAFTAMQQNPAAAMQYMNDPDVAKAMELMMRMCVRADQMQRCGVCFSLLWACDEPVILAA
jgi:hypothetical protein